MTDIPVRVIIDAIDNASKDLQGFGKNLEGVAGQMRTVGAAGLVVGGITLGLAKGFIQQAGAMEQNQIAFETMLGSADKANTLLKEMTEFAAKTPFDLPGVIDAGKQLLAYGFAQEQVIDTTRMLGDVAAGLNIPLGDIIYLFGTLRAQGRAYTKDLNQFTARGIPILDALAKQYGITKAEVFDFAAAGKISFEDIEKAFQGMTNEGGLFFNLMDKQSKSTLGTWSNFKDSLIRVQITLGQALLPAVNEIMRAIMPVVEAFGKWAKENPELVKKLVIAGLAIGAIGAVLITIGVIIPPIIAAVGLLGAAIGVIGSILSGIATVVGIVVAVLGGPLTLIILAVVGLIALLTIAWKKNWFDIQGKTKAVIDALVGTFNGLVSGFKTLWGWLKIIGQAFVDMGRYFLDVLRYGDWGNDWLSHLPEKIQGVVMAVGQFIVGVMDFFKAIPEGLVNIGKSIVAFFEAIPGWIDAALAAAGQALYNFFTQTLPFAVGFAVGRIVKFFTVDIPAAWTALVEWATVTVPNFFIQLGLWIWTGLTNAYLSVVQWATVDVPNAFISLMTWLSEAIPAMWESFVQWIINMKNSSLAAIDQFIKNTISFFTNLWTSIVALAIKIYTDVVNWFTNTKNDAIAGIEALPGEVTRVFNNAKEAAVNKAKEIYEGVKGWFDKVINFFKDIVDWAGKAASAAANAASAGFNAGKRQYGGPVSAASSYIVGEAGAEGFTPQTAGYITPHGAYASKGGGGGNTIQFIVNTSMIINSPTERRSLAEALYKDLATLARSQNMTVAELMGA